MRVLVTYTIKGITRIEMYRIAGCLDILSAESFLKSLNNGWTILRVKEI